jgi:predicted DNA-binding ribbon-helix-helix protein
MANRIVDKTGSAARATISFSHKIYDSLKETAAAKKVSIAWIVREAVESYLDTLAKTDSCQNVAVLGKPENV